MSAMVEEIRRAIRQSGRSLYELAEASGVNRSQLSRLMSSERGMSAGNLEALADVMGLEFRLAPKRRQRKAVR